MFDLKNWLRFLTLCVSMSTFLACSGETGGTPAPSGFGTGGAAGSAGGAAGSGGTPHGGASGFESDDPTSRATQGAIADAGSGRSGGGGSGGSAGTGGGTPPVTPPPGGAGDTTRAIVEADIIQIQGDTLYALAEYGGLSVIDISNADDLRMLGRYGIRALPFEMYVRSGVAYAMYSSFPRYERQADGTSRYVVSSRIVAIDVTNPAAMKELGVFDLPGDLSDSRLVGDVIYVVTHENGSCWGCVSNQPRTTVTSLAAGDPANIHKIEQLTFADQRSNAGWYRRSIHVTTDRLYVSGMVYNGAWGPDTGHSTIQVVDISDPRGRLVAGAQVPVNGQIESRWQMDELSGVLRVVSQSGSTWANGPPPVVETFTIESAQHIAPLGKLTLTLPKRENLKSVRFDGARAYAVTFEQKDPLFTIDLGDPAAPKQVGEVEMPGFLHHMEPRGDRLVALGVDSGNTSGGLTVSIFDVADLARPTLISRANFGSQWGGLPEDQDRIHKAFRLFDERGLIVMPFSGWSYASAGPGCGSYVSGVQLFDFTRDEVTLRGIVPLRGNARRAFLHGDALFAVSDDQVASFDIDNRDAPVRRGKLALANVANKTVRFGDHLVALGSDWWTSEPQITVVPIAAGAQGIPVATIDLAKAVNTGNDLCYGRYWSSFAANSQLFVEGSSVYIAYDAGFAGTSGRGRMGFAVIDMADPTHPVLRGSTVLEIVKTPQQAYSYGYYGCGVGYYANPTGVWSSGDRLAKVGTTIVVQELLPVDLPDAGYTPYAARPTQAILHAVDLSNPENIHLASTTTIGDGLSASGIFAAGSQVFTSHQENVATSPGRTRFFIDRLDLTVPSAPTRNKINVPGSLLSVDGQGDRVMTVDYRRTVTAIDEGPQTPPPCNVQSGFGQAGWVYGANGYGRPIACVRLDRTLRLVALAPSGATLLDSFEPAGDLVTKVETGSDRIWLERRKYVPGTPAGSGIPGAGGYNELSVETLTGIRAGDLQSASRVSRPGETLIPDRNGTRFVVQSWYDNRLTVIDTADAALPRQVLEHHGNNSGYYAATSGITLDSDYLLLSMGKYGAAALPLH
jgi:hypothetical protein